MKTNFTQSKSHWNWKYFIVIVFNSVCVSLSSITLNSCASVRMGVRSGYSWPLNPNVIEFLRFCPRIFITSNTWKTRKWTSFRKNRVHFLQFCSHQLPNYGKIFKFDKTTPLPLQNPKKWNSAYAFVCSTYYVRMCVCVILYSVYPVLCIHLKPNQLKSVKVQNGKSAILVHSNKIYRCIVELNL